MAALKLLRERASGKWVCPDGTLTSDLRQALDVHSFSQALRLCRVHKLTGIDMVLRTGPQKDDVILPLEDL